MKHIVDVDQIIKGEVDYSEIEGRYAFITMKAGMTGFDWKKAFKALNIMSEQGWRYRDWIGATLGGFRDWIGATLGGFLMERVQLSEQII